MQFRDHARSKVSFRIASRYQLSSALCWFFRITVIGLINRGHWSPKQAAGVDLEQIKAREQQVRLRLVTMAHVAAPSFISAVIGSLLFDLWQAKRAMRIEHGQFGFATAFIAHRVLSFVDVNAFVHRSHCLRR